MEEAIATVLTCFVLIYFVSFGVKIKITLTTIMINYLRVLSASFFLSPARQVQVLLHLLPYGTRPIKIAVTLEKKNTVFDLKTTICKQYNAEIADSK